MLINNYFIPNIQTRKNITQPKHAKGCFYNAIVLDAYKPIIKKVAFSGGVEEELPALSRTSYRTNPKFIEISERLKRRETQEGVTLDSPKLANWIYNKLSNKTKFEWIAHVVPKCQGGENNWLEAEATAVYACIILGGQLQKGITSMAASGGHDTKRGAYGDSIERLSNVYRARYYMDRNSPEFLKIAIDLAKKANSVYLLDTQEKLKSKNDVNRSQSQLINVKPDDTSNLPELSPVSFITNSYLRAFNEKVDTQCSENGWTKDSPGLVNWLAQQNKKDYNNILKAEAVAIYTCAITERQIRRELLKISPSELHPITKHYGNCLEKLSDIYREKFNLDPTKPHYLEIAHDLAKQAGNSYKSYGNKPYYTQGNSHLIHLKVNVPSNAFINIKGFKESAKYKELKPNIDYYEDLLKLCLAFKEIEEGAHNVYAPDIIEDLINLYEIKEDQGTRNLYKAHVEKVVSVKQEPELWFYEQMKREIENMPEISKNQKKIKKTRLKKIYLAQDKAI